MGYDLSGKKAIVTGCASPSGIGYALAIRLATDGADVAVSDFCKTNDDSDKNWKNLNALSEEIRALGRVSCVVPADITDEKQVAEMVAAANEAMGGLNVLCNNAGAVFGMNLTFMISPADWRKMIDINLTGTFIVSAAVAKLMMKSGKGGSIINTASWRGRYPAQFLGAYCAAKAGVLSLTEVMALELSHQKIRVNAICPGKVDTEMERMGWGIKADAFGKTVEEIKKEEEAKIPLGHIASPKDISNLVAFLASDDSSYMTGQALYITGGMTLLNVR